MNVARLTCLPFLHAVWCGIVGYYLAFAYLFPENRHALFVLAIVVPAVLHGLYNVFGWSLLGSGIAFIGVAMLIIYMQKGDGFIAALRSRNI